MAHNVSNEYKQVIYSGDARNKLKILFNNVELEDADRYCERMTVKSRIVPNGAKIFSLNNFISKEVELILHDIDTSIIKDQISISIGTLVGNSYEYVPIGIFNIQDTPTNDKRKTTIKLRDNSVKFDFNYNAQELIEENGGSATKLQILQDICSQAGVTCNITSFIGYLDDIGVYDNTITAREYISRIAEQAGRIATINRSGELIFVDLNNLTTWEIPIEIVEKYENGTKFKIGRVVYEDGIVRYETPTSTDDTLFLDGSNNYINGELVKEQASSSDNSYSLQNTGEADLAYFELEGKTEQETRSGKNLFKNDDFNETNHDITFTNINNSLNISGTSTATYYPSVVMYADGSHSILNWVATTSNINAEKGYFNDSGDTIISVFQNGNRTGQQRIVIGYEDNTIDTYYLNSTDFATKTYTTNKRINFICIANHPSQTYNVTFKIMISKSGGDYEPYGQMPSPDYPSELVSVGYKNLLKLASGSISNRNTTLTIENDVINFKSTGATSYVAYGIDNELRATNYGNYVAYKSMVLKAGTYTLSNEYISGNTTTSTTGGNFLRINIYGRPIGDTGLVGTILSQIYIEKHNGENTFTIAEDMEVNAVIYLYASNATIDINFRVILTRGVQTHSYIPYGKYGIEVINKGENLFDLDWIQYRTNAGITATKGDGYIILNGTATATAYINYFVPSGVFQGSYSWFLRNDGNVTLSFRINRSQGGTVNANITGTTTKNQLTSNYVTSGYIQINNGTVLDNCKVYIDIRKGDVSLNNYIFKSYQNNTQLYVLDNPLRSIGDTKDLLYIKNGMLYVERKIKSIILNGSETWKSYNSSAPYGLVLTDNKDFNSDSADFKSNYFENKIWSQTTFVNYNSLVSSVGGYPKELRFRYADITSLANFKTWLSTHNTEVQYILATPYIEELGEIEIPNTYEGTTYIDISSNINTNSYLQYRQSKTQLEAILQNTNQFDIDSLKTGKILGNPAIDSYDLIQIHDTYKNETYTTLATNDLVYTGVLINTFDTQIGEEAKEQNVFVNGEETFKKWARTKIDNVEGSISLQAGQINETNGRINEANLTIDSQGALLNVIANNSNIDIEYDGDTPISGEVREVTTTTGFTFNAEGMTISDSSSNFYALHRNTGTYYYDGAIEPSKIVGQYTKDGSKQKDLVLFGVYYYGMEQITDTPMFVTQLYNDENGEECVGHFYNRGD